VVAYPARKEYDPAKQKYVRVWTYNHQETLKLFKDRWAMFNLAKKNEKEFMMADIGQYRSRVAKTNTVEYRCARNETLGRIVELISEWMRNQESEKDAQREEEGSTLYKRSCGQLKGNDTDRWNIL
jgi:hypothetical protein